MHTVDFAARRERLSAGIRTPIKMTMMDVTTSNSTNVNADLGA
ncbi:MAG: hypothetical protein DHS20C16_01290 [Phycisphaerae bacterium]|nr:MAG: hypothetical protein DHS20C16_01290 [Phycisphaerae bacterium]